MRAAADRRAGALVLAGACLALAGCSEGAEVADPYEPSEVEGEAGAAGTTVAFTEIGAAAVGLETATARQVGNHTVVDYAALIYDGKGQPWVYTVQYERVFARVEIVVDRITDGQVLITSGLDPGTEVVTTGVTEVYGTELGMGGSH